MKNNLDSPSDQQTERLSPNSVQLKGNGSGALYVVATPIGHLDDMTPRAIATLNAVDTILAEDTRHSGTLLNHFSIQTHTIAYHDHNERQLAPEVIRRLQQGETYALISDAGTPLVSDPGYYLIQQAQQAGLPVIPVPGACALIAALSVAGLPTDRFSFQGFLPPKQQARETQLSTLKLNVETLVFYEAPHRLNACITSMLTVFGSDRQACVAREITKFYETIKTGSLEELDAWLSADPGQCRGEIVIMVMGMKDHAPEKEESERVLSVLLEYLSPSQAVAATVKLTGGKKNQLYALAQTLKSESDSPE